jgi:hypothetical protein
MAPAKNRLSEWVFFSKAAVFISEGIYSALSCRFVGLFIYLGGLRELTEPVYPGANN